MTCWTLAHSITLVAAVAGVGRAWYERWQENREIERERQRMFKGHL
jgi:hypothetical protein